MYVFYGCGGCVLKVSLLSLQQNVVFYRDLQCFETYIFEGRELTSNSDWFSAYSATKEHIGLRHGDARQTGVCVCVFVCGREDTQMLASCAIPIFCTCCI